ncbi:MAG: DNA polymerase I [Pseudomonadota bacterium]
MDNHLYLIDASGFIFRAYHALPSLTRPDGTPVGAVLGYASMVIKLLREHAPSHMAVVFDVSRNTFRNDIYPAYKANRDEPPEDLIPQFALVRQMTTAFNLPQVELEGYEADDVIATLARQAAQAGMDVTIVSSDKDLMQLIGPKIRMYDPIKNLPLQEEAVFAKFGVTPDKVVDIQALAGDATDNVPGVPGIGVKTAAELINTFGSLENLLAHAATITQPKRRESLLTHAEAARISLKLVTLCDTVPLTCALDDFRPAAFDIAKAASFLSEQGFKSILSRLPAPDGMNPPPLPSTVTTPAAPMAAASSIEGLSVPLLITTYRTVTTADALTAWLHQATRDYILAVDTETTDLTPARARLVGICLAGSASDAIYIPISHIASNPLTDPPPENMAIADVVRILAPVMADPSILKIGHNMKYDWQMLANAGMTPVSVTDTMMMSYALYGTAHGHGMDELALRFLNHTAVSYDSVTGTGVKRITFDQVPVDVATHYAAEDAASTLAFYHYLRPRLQSAATNAVYEDIDRPLIPVIARMEQAGIRVDPQILQNLGTKFNHRLQEISARIFTSVGHPFNLGSPKQMGAVLFGELGLPGGKKTKTGEWSTAADVLELLAEQGHDVVTEILEWRQLSKLISTYSDALPKAIVPQTGRVHTSYALAYTTTGRLASSEPNLQNIPIRTDEGKSIRTAFIAAPGHKLISADYSQIELRLIAAMAGIERLKQAFRDGIDIHTATAAEILGVPLDQVSPQLRREAKAINFGIIYGISGFGLAKQIGRSVGESAAFIKTYFARFPELHAFMETTKAFAREHGYVQTLMGRCCTIQGMRDTNPARRASAERQAINAPVQGTAADIIRLAMAAVDQALLAENLQAKLLLQVHDELVLEAPDHEVERVIALLHQVMPSVISLDVPMLIEAKAADNWAAAH